jgi:DNA mismatch repair protein MutS2
LAATFAQTETGRAKVRGLFPSADGLEIAEALDEAAEAIVAAERVGRTPLRDLEPPRPFLTRIAQSSGLGFEPEFGPLVRLARSAEQIRERKSEYHDLPHLARRLSELPDFSSIVLKASRLFEPDGALRDGASPKLLMLRTRLRRQRQDLYERARRFAGSAAADDTETVVVLREGRYCVSVPAATASRLAGIVHGRSGTGQTLFLEPMEMTEGNNELSLLSSDILREEERIRREFGNELLARNGEFERAGEILFRLDALEARAGFCRTIEGIRPDFSSDGRWELSGARHPLLDSRLTSVRSGALSEEKKGREAVPLDFELPGAAKCLLLSGPNAGGKTVALKTAGLFSMLAQSGFHLPARRATLPLFSRFFALVGDEQAILSDLSTFSSSMRRLAAILREAGDGTLVLLDELGTGTDPEEGSAIAMACLEELLRMGARVIVTTHLSAVKEFAAARPDCRVAAMEFDEGTGRPTYRLAAGILGRSRALATAREQGLPASTILRVEALLGESWIRRERLESEAAEILSRVRREEEELSRALAETREREERLARAEESLSRDRRQILREAKESLDRAKHDFRSAASRAVEEIRREKLSTARAAEVVSRIEESRRVDPRLAAVEEEAALAAENLRIGDSVKLRGGSAAGKIVELSGGMATLVASGKRISVPAANLVAARAMPPRAAPSRSSPIPGNVTEVNVIGKRVEEAIDEVDHAIDQLLLEGEGHLRVIHGHGTGRLRDGLREYFRRHRSIESFRPGEPREGGNGATIVVLK